jgi:HD-GYP domain-containing protein (c-di-GMP phosphodiesterase class II)
VPGHGERTARLARAIGIRLGLTMADLRDLEVAGRLVDLGKAMIRPTILQKSGPLTATEAESLRCHPLRAAELLECVPGLRSVAAILGAQVERYDGKGGPAGLRAERIPLAARIVAVAAGFDLLHSCTEDQPLSWRAALALVGEERGEAFDPRVVDRLVDAVEAAPPDESSREVLLVRGGTLPWRPEPVGQAGGADEDDDPAALGDDALELVECEREAR